MISSTEVSQLHERRLAQVGYGVWIDNPGNAVNGYFADCAYASTGDSVPAYHIYTADGIKGMEIEGN